MVDVQITVTSDCGVSLEDIFTFNASIIGEYTKWARIRSRGGTTLTFISRVNTPSECIKLWENLNFQYFSL